MHKHICAGAINNHTREKDKHKKSYCVQKWSITLSCTLLKCAGKKMHLSRSKQLASLLTTGGLLSIDMIVFLVAI